MAEKKLLEQFAERIRDLHYSRRTEDAYVDWGRRYILFHKKRHPLEMGSKEINEYLSYLANSRKVSASTQNQCRYAILFLYRQVLGIEVEGVDIIQAKEGKHLPVVLNKEDTLRILDCVEGELFNLMARLLYGAGLRMQECQQLRIKDIEFSSYIITVRGGKGNKDRTVPLPKSLVKPLMDQMAIARRLHEIDRQRGMPGVWVPDSLDKKFKNIGCEFGWFWVFPANAYSVILK